MVQSILLAFNIVSTLCQTFGASQQSGVHRDGQISYGNFKRDWGKRLKIGRAHV